MTYSIEKVTTLIGAHRYGTRQADIAFLLTDSRSLCFPEETLFFALRSERNDGHRYIDELYRRGVRNFVVEQLPDEWAARFAEANFLKVVGTREALQRLAERHRDEYDIPIVGITGSNGKTVVKEWLYQLLSADGDITRSPRSYNSQIGVPLSVWLLNEHTTTGLFEAGISQPGEMQALSSIIQPTIGVLTNIGQAHQENFPSLEAKCKEKLTLFHDAQVVVYPLDDEMVARCVSQFAYKGRQVAWSTTDPRAALFVKDIAVDGTTGPGHRPSTTITYIYKGENSTAAAPASPQAGSVSAAFTIPFIDEASVQNAITCAAVALHLGMTADTLAARMAALEPVAMRLEVKEGQRGCTLINDSYNSDIHSLDIALDFMNRRPDTLGRRRTLVLSDIEQTGMPPRQLYEEVNRLCHKRGVEKLVAIGPMLSAQAEVLDLDERHFFPTVDAFIGSDLFASLHDEVILLKGARRFGFDQLTELLVRKVHETTLEVNLNALVDNLNYYRSLMAPGTKMVCMIKADGYGAGAVEIAKTLQDHRVDYLAVAVADEGVTLRKNGITANIMVMNPEMTAFKTMFDYDLEPEVYSFRLLDALINAAEREGITGWPVHIKLDTGMRRLGFNTAGSWRTGDTAAAGGEPARQPDDVDRLVARLHQQTALIPRSVFSHFVGSDADCLDAFSDLQFARFDEASRRLQAAFPHHILRHMDNSAGIEHFPGRQMDMCRLGIGLYGINPRTNAMLHNVSTLKTTILQLRHVKAGESVGYSRRTVLQRDSLIAAIPIGYADGLNRHLGNRRGHCLVNGQQAPYVGNICMDVAMVDVTGIPCQEGDSVEIFGDHLPVTALSDALDTIPYEVLTGISNRVKRIYYQD